ncbi:MAG: glycosyltransferase family 2 protein [marine benthic group bacterium]|nr:glycosyltransferase family 2 protein [Candidatus Benthicola marisminoris]
MKTLDAVVPVYNEEAILPELNRRLVDTLEALPYEWRVVYVDDGSRDRTPELLAGFSDEDSRVGVVHLSRNFGQQLAISAGLAMSTADAVVLLDGDLQDPPEVIPLLVEKWESGYDVVYAVKRDRKEALPKRALFSLFYKILRKLSNVDIPADAGNFSLMDRSVVDVINTMPERDRYVSGLRAYVGGRQTGVEFERAPRYAGQPRQSPLKLVRMATDAFFAFSELPLRLATILGFFVSVIAFLVLLTVLYKRLISGEAIVGWASTMTSILFLGGIQLIAVGVIGEYIGRIYNEAKGRPAWVVGRYRNLSSGSSESLKALHEGRDPT